MVYVSQPAVSSLVSRVAALVRRARQNSCFLQIRSMTAQELKDFARKKIGY
jgi:hypothetical protein